MFIVMMYLTAKVAAKVASNPTFTSTDVSKLYDISQTNTISEHYLNNFIVEPLCNYSDAICWHESPYCCHNDYY